MIKRRAELQWKSCFLSRRVRFYMLLIRGFTLPKSASAKPARSTGFTKFGCNVKNGAASKISASILLSPPSPAMYLPGALTTDS